MVWWNDFAFAGDLFQRHGFRAITTRSHHHPENTFMNQIGACAAQPRGKQTIRRRWRAAALHVTKNRDTGFEVREFLELSGQTHRVAIMFCFKGGQLKLAGIRDSIMEVFRITKLDEVFDIYKNETAAVDAFQRHA